MLIKGHHIATAAIMLYGGSTFSPSILKDDNSLMRVDDSWPDALLLLEQGKVIVKHYDQDVDSRMGGEGHVEFMEAGEDALLVFTAALLGLITERSVQVEDPLYLAQYVSHRMRRIPNEFIKFPLTRPVPGRTPLWQQQQHLTTHSTGRAISLAPIENLSVAAAHARRLIRALGACLFGKN